MLYTKTAERILVKIQAIQAIFEDKIVRNYSWQTNVYELPCQTINRKCV